MEAKEFSKFSASKLNIFNDKSKEIHYLLSYKYYLMQTLKNLKPSKT
jgi:hypothetical protein